MNSISITFEHPLLLILVPVCLAAVLIPFCRQPAVLRRRPRRFVPALLRCVTAVLLVLILSGMRIVRYDNTTDIVILADCSDSTAGAREEILARAQELKTELAGTGLGARTDIEIICMDEDCDYTDLEQAMEAAAQSMSDDAYKQIILLSDGCETSGDAEALARRLALEGIKIETEYFTTGTEDEVQIEAFTAQQGIYTGEEITFTVEVRSSCETQMLLQLLKDGEVIYSQTLSAQTGSSTYELGDTAGEPGEYEYTIAILPDTDTCSDNNASTLTVGAAACPTVLVVADRLINAGSFEKRLSSACDVTSVAAKYAPTDINELLKYDEVILVNLDVADVPEDFGTVLSEYVGIYGRSLLMTGGKSTYMYGGMRDTVYEEMLPVELELTKEDNGESVALVLILDCSSSMNGTNLTVAKQGAIKCIEAMSANDSIGIVSFSSKAAVEAELTVADSAHKTILGRTVSGLKTSRGTYYREALTLAFEMLENSDAGLRHVMFLSDGQPQDSGYLDVVEEMAAEGITVSSIGLGYTSSALERIAEYGGGRSYYVSRASELPDVMLSETQEVAVSSLKSGEFAIEIGRDSELNADLETIRAADDAELSVEAAAAVSGGDAVLLADGGSVLTVSGYIGTTPKEDAEVYLTVEGEIPFYAVHDYGNGRVAFVAGDMFGTWSQSWIDSDEAVKLLQNMVRTTIDSGHLDESMFNTQFGNPEGVSYASEYNAFAEGGRELLDALEELTADVALDTGITHDPTGILAVMSCILLLAEITIRKFGLGRRLRFK